MRSKYYTGYGVLSKNRCNKPTNLNRLNHGENCDKTGGKSDDVISNCFRNVLIPKKNLRRQWIMLK